jgi:hypothetical protein
MTVAIDTPLVPVLQHFWEWLGTGHCQIKSRGGSGLISLIPNQLQKDMYFTMLVQAKAGRPIRLIILKGRKPGCSTFIQALGYFLVRHYPHISAQVLAHTDRSTQDIFEIAARMYVHDPDNAQRPAWPTAGTISFMEEHDSQFNIRTLGGQFASSSANHQFVHVSELAKVQGGKDFVQDQMASVSGSIADTPNTFLFIESTALHADESGEFQRLCETVQRGEGPFGFVFSPWFNEPSNTVAGAGPLPTFPEGDEWKADREAEDALREQFPQLSDGQLFWRRNKIMQLGGLHKFRQDHPATPEEAFEAATGRIFPKLRKATHDWRAAPEELLAQGYGFYRGVDWGGRDPFACLWIAHNPRARSRFTVDAKECPETWRELTHWNWGPHGKPVDADNHTIDAGRYAVTYYRMTGHVHVFREVYDADFVARGDSVADNAHAVLTENGSWPIGGTVADRGRPDCINTFINQGIPTEGYNIPGVIGRGGEVQFGIDRLSELIVASYPIEYDPEPLPVEEVHRRRQSRTGLTFGYSGLEELYAERQRTAERGGVAVADLPCGRW